MENGAVKASSVEERIEASATPDELHVSSPASVIGPSTPESAADQRTGQKLLISDAEFCDRDCDEEEMEFVSYEDDDAAGLMEEPVAISRVRAIALAKRSTGRECKVTLESARAKLDRVKASGEKHLKKRKLENFLCGQVDAEVNLLLPSEFQGQPKVVKSKEFSVDKARAKLKAVKIKELDKANVNKQMNMYIISSTGIASRKASKACSIDEELLREGIWVRQAKLKLEAAKEKSSKSNRKRKSKTLGTKKRNVQRRSSLEVTCMDTEDEEDDIDLINAADSVQVALDTIVSKEATLEGKRRKASKQKPVRVSERIANSRLRMQQGLVTLKVKAVIGNKSAKSRRNKGNKQEEPNTEICTGLSGTREDTKATSSERVTELSAAVSMEFTLAVELTPPAKKRKIQQALVDTMPPGARLLSGVEFVPPVSPYGLIQEHLYQNPWKVLVACILLNQTGGRQMHKVIWELFELCPDAETCISTETEKIGCVIHSLGLQNKRAKTLQRFSRDYMGTTWTNVTQLHGIGEYARDAYAIFCEGRWQDVQPKDLVLYKYWRWLSDTQGLGYGFSQIE